MASDARTPDAALAPDVVPFEVAVRTCYETPELMAEYRRLTGSTLGFDDRPPIARLIDEAAKHDPWEGQWGPFFRFVRDVVWLPLLVQEVSA